jgi:hypothetical protein
MQVRECDEAHAVLHLSRNELILLNNALNEVCNGLDLPDFATRLGAERGELQKLLRQHGGDVVLVAVAQKQRPRR